jgi:hypothetical protein
MGLKPITAFSSLGSKQRDHAKYMNLIKLGWSLPEQKKRGERINKIYRIFGMTPLISNPVNPVNPVFSYLLKLSGSHFFIEIAMEI